MPKYDIPSYRSERESGIGDLVRATSSVAYLVPLLPVTPEEVGLSGDIERVFAASHSDGEFDLYRMKDVLVTAGVTNKNRDTFDRVEVWAARHTSEDKPFNFEHRPLDIIGHITASRVVDDGMNEVDDSTPIEDLPSKYHIVNGSVLYMSVGDAERQDLMARTVAEIEKGEWYVSMECFFRGFDYGVTGPDGSEHVVARDADTAWLTKHLVQYGGDGDYTDEQTGAKYRLSRVLRNITFSGKGLVRKPANSDSIIFRVAAAFNPMPSISGYLNSRQCATSIDSDTEEPISMAEPNAVEQSLRDENSRLSQQVTNLHQEIAGLKSKDTEAVVAGLRKDVSTRDESIASLTTQLDAITASSRDLEARADRAEAELSAARDEIADIRTLETRRDRVAAMREMGADESVSDALADTWSHLTDEQFEKTLERVAASWKKPKVDPVVTAITRAKATPEPALATASDNSREEREQSFAKITDFLGNSLKAARQGRYSAHADSTTEK